MIRLTMRSQTPQEVVLEVDGWVSGKNVEIVKQEGTRLLHETQRLILDLSGVKFIDRKGFTLLQGWSGERLGLQTFKYVASLVRLLGLHSTHP